MHYLAANRCHKFKMQNTKANTTTKPRLNLYEVNLGKDALQTDATLEQTQDGRNANKHRSKGSKQG